MTKRWIAEGRDVVEEGGGAFILTIDEGAWAGTESAYHAAQMIAVQHNAAFELIAFFEDYIPAPSVIPNESMQQFIRVLFALREALAIKKEA